MAKVRDLKNFYKTVTKKCNGMSDDNIPPFSFSESGSGIREFLNSGHKSWRLDSGGWTLEVRLWTLDLGRWTLDAGPWTLDPGLWTLDSGRWTLDAGLWTLDSGLWTPDIVVDCCRTESEPSFFFA